MPNYYGSEGRVGRVQTYGPANNAPAGGRSSAGRQSLAGGAPADGWRSAGGQLPTGTAGGFGAAASPAYSNGAQGQIPQYYTAPNGALYMRGQDGQFYLVAAAGHAVGANAGGAWKGQSMPQQSQMAQPAQQPQQLQQPQQPQQSQPRKKRRGGMWIGIVVAIVCLVAAGLIAWNFLSGSNSAARQGELGDLSTMSDAEIQAQIDDLVEKSMFNISIASQVNFANGTSPGELKIQNPGNNSMLMQVQILRDDTGDVIYESGVIEPNHHVESDVLAVDLPAGSYDCAAVFYALDPQTEARVGQATAEITINVMA